MTTKWYLTDLDKVKKHGHNVFSTFSCGGGSSMGYKLAGYDVIGANDIDPVMADHYKLNLKPKHYFLCPINELKHKDLPKEFFDIDILDGSPPCSTFSMLGNREEDWQINKVFREGQAKQVLDDLFYDWIDLVAHLKPKVALGENVIGLITGNAKGYVNEITKQLKAIGYEVQLFTVNSATTGVPQSRRRVYFIARRADLNYKNLELKFDSPVVTVKQAFSELPELTPDEIESTKINSEKAKLLYHNTPMGSSFGKAHLKLFKKDGWFNAFRLHINKPSHSLTSSALKHQIHHPTTFRFCTINEVKMLSSFPLDYQYNKEEVMYYMMGMSVPPLTMKCIATQIYEQWFKNGKK